MYHRYVERGGVRAEARRRCAEWWIMGSDIGAGSAACEAGLWVASMCEKTLHDASQASLRWSLPRSAFLFLVGQGRGLEEATMRGVTSGN